MEIEKNKIVLKHQTSRRDGMLRRATMLIINFCAAAVLSVTLPIVSVAQTPQPITPQMAAQRLAIMRHAEAFDGRRNLYSIDTTRNLIRVRASGRGAIPVLPSVQTPVAGAVYTLPASGLVKPAQIVVDGLGNVIICDQGDQTVKMIYAAGHLPKLPSDPTIGDLYVLSSLPSSQGASVRPHAEAKPVLANRVHPEDDPGSSLPTIPGVPTTMGYINTVAGSNQGLGATNGDGGPATSAELANPTTIAFDGAGNLYITDKQGTSIRMVDGSGNISTFAGGTASTDAAPNGPAVGAFLGAPTSIAFDSAGNLFIADSVDAVIDEVPANSGMMKVYAGEFLVAGTDGDGGPAAQAHLNLPASIAIDSDDSLYVLDYNTITVRKITSDGTINTIVGAVFNNCFGVGDCGDGGPASAALMYNPTGIIVDSNKNLLIADAYLFSTRVVFNGGAAMECLIALENPGSFSLPGGGTSCAGSPTPSPRVTQGNIYTIAGGSYCMANGCGDGNLATMSNMNQPAGGLAVDGAGNIFVNDSLDGAIRRVDATTGTISSVVGVANPVGTALNGFEGDSGPATSAQIGASSPPGGLAFDSHGNLFLADSPNYNVRAVAGAGALPLTPQTITFGSLSNVTYGVAPITLTATADSGLPISYAVTCSTSTCPASVSDSTLTITGVGSVTVTASQPGDSTYSAATPVSQTLTIGQGTITVTATSFSQPVGTPLSATLPFTVTGVASGDTLSGNPDFSTAYTTSSPIGQTYSIHLTQGGLAISPATSTANYTFVFVDGTLTVSGGTSQTITFPALPSTITYGDKPIALAATSSSGLPITYAATGSAFITGSASTGWTLSIVSAGQGTVTATQPGNTTYAAATPVAQVISVKQATLTVSAANLSQSFGSALPSPLPYTVSGLVGSDSTTGSPALSTTYTKITPAGSSVPISIAQGTLSIAAPALPGNYSLNLVPGTITVTAAASTITFPTIGARSYGSVVSLAATASSGLPITYTVTGNATLSGSTLTITGLGPISVTASQPGNSSYAAATPVTQAFTATQAVLTVTAQPVMRAQGASNPTFTATITGFVNGDADTPLVLTGSPIITTTATPASAPGTYPITPALGTLFANNYTFSFVPGVLTVSAPPSYIITASPTALTIPLGQSGQTSLAVQSVNGYTGTVTFSCGQAPLGISCTFSPSTVTINPTMAVPNQSNLSTLTITTTGPSAPTAQSDSKGSTTAAGLFLIPGGFAGLFLAIHRRRLSSNIKLRQLLMLAVLLSGAMGLGACGSSNNQFQAPIGSTTLLVTATSSGASGTGSQNATNILYLTVDVTKLQ